MAATLGVEPVPYDLNVYRGDTFILPLDFTQGEGEAEVPLVLQPLGWSAQVRDQPDSLEASTTITVDATDAATGRLVLKLTAAETAVATTGRWDLQNSSGGVTYTYVQGRFIVARDVTRG